MNKTATTETKKIAIIGGGAAGFFCAANLNNLPDSVEITMYEKTKKFLSKVLVSGGGRCNVTNSENRLAEFLENYPRGKKELRSVFSRFSNQDTINWFETRGVKLKTEPDGRMFPVSNRSETIADCLWNESLKVEKKQGYELIDVKKENEEFILRFHVNDGSQKEIQQVHAHFLVISSGGRSHEDGYHFLNSTGHTVVKPVPSLFTFNLKDPNLKSLMGVSVPDGSVKISGTNFFSEGPILITHWGLSGPAILKLSAHAARYLFEKNYSFTLTVNWLKMDEEEVRQIITETKNHKSGLSLENHFPFLLPRRLLFYLLEKSQVKLTKRWAELSKKEIHQLIAVLIHDEFQVGGKTTFKEEFVTSGGVSLPEINFSTMESRKQENLFFCGEVLDIDALTGGFNFQSAWSTSYISAQTISNRILKR